MIGLAGRAPTFQTREQVRARLIVIDIVIVGAIGVWAGALVGCRPPTATPAATIGNRPSAAVVPRWPVPHGPITAEAMKAYFVARFPAAVEDGTVKLDFGNGDVADDVLRELAALGIDDMSEVAAMVPIDLETRGFAALTASGAPSTNLAGLMRDLMIMHDTRRYFTDAWHHGWITTGPEDFPIPAAYGVDFDLMRRLGVWSGDD